MTLKPDNHNRYRCARCREWKYKNDFPENKKKQNGLDSYCWTCRKEYTELWRQKKGLNQRKRGRPKGSTSPKKERQDTTLEERRLKTMMYGYIPRGHISKYCKRCKRLYSEQIINKDTLLCMVCNRKVEKEQADKRKRGRPRKYKGNDRKRRLQSIRKSKSIALYRANKKAARHNRDIRLKNGGTFTGKEWLDLCEKYDNVCLCCKSKTRPLTPDHVLPVSKGGKNTIDNIQPLCFDCNMAKGTQETDYR